MRSIGGQDIVEGNRKLILAILWQAMRLHIFIVLERLSQRLGKPRINADADLLSWCAILCSFLLFFSLMLACMYFPELCLCNVSCVIADMLRIGRMRA